MTSRFFIFVLCLGHVWPAFGAAAVEYEPLSSRDLLIADFEGPTDGDWQAEGAAFGSRPAVANVSPGNKVVGQWGKGLVNSYLGGDVPTGRLTSPPFVIQRKRINFLIGAGNHDGATCINLVVEGKTLRTAVGPALKNDKDQEVLDWHGWDVADFVNGRQCVAVRVYPGREDSLGVSLRAQGQDAELKTLDAWRMKSIY